MERLAKINGRLDPACYLEQHCDSELCQGYVVCFHEITQADQERMVRRFFNGNFPDYAEVIASSLDLNNSDCTQQDFVYFQGDETNRDRNQLDPSDIVVEIQRKAHIMGKYSLTLFKGIYKFFNPDYIYFSKAITDDWEYTLVFKVKKDNEIVYYGDLSGVYP
jgi:hypothetical protein